MNWRRSRDCGRPKDDCTTTITKVMVRAGVRMKYLLLVSFFTDFFSVRFSTLGRLPASFLFNKMSAQELSRWRAAVSTSPSFGCSPPPSPGPRLLPLTLAAASSHTPFPFSIFFPGVSKALSSISPVTSLIKRNADDSCMRFC